MTNEVHNAFPNPIETGIKPFATVEYCGTPEGRYLPTFPEAEGSVDSKGDA